MELAVELTRWKWQSHWRWKDLSSVEDTAYGSAIVAVVQSFLSAFALSVSPAEVAFASGTYGEPRVRQAIPVCPTSSRSVRLVDSKSFTTAVESRRWITLASQTKAPKIVSRARLELLFCKILRNLQMRLGTFSKKCATTQLLLFISFTNYSNLQKLLLCKGCNRPALGVIDSSLFTSLVVVVGQC